MAENDTGDREWIGKKISETTLRALDFLDFVNAEGRVHRKQIKEHLHIEGDSSFDYLANTLLKAGKIERHGESGYYSIPGWSKERDIMRTEVKAMIVKLKQAHPAAPKNFPEPFFKFICVRNGIDSTDPDLFSYFKKVVKEEGFAVYSK